MLSFSPVLVCFYHRDSEEHRLICHWLSVNVNTVLSGYDCSLNLSSPLKRNEILDRGCLLWKSSSDHCQTAASAPLGTRESGRRRRGHYGQSEVVMASAAKGPQWVPQWSSFKNSLFIFHVETCPNLVAATISIFRILHNSVLPEPNPNH